MLQHLLLLELLLMLTLLFLILEFAVIHDPANWRLRHRGNFHQINACFFGQEQRLPDAHDAKRLSFYADQANLRCVDFFVDALRLLQCDGLAPCSEKIKPCHFAPRLRSEAARSVSQASFARDPDRRVYARQPDWLPFPCRQRQFGKAAYSSYVRVFYR